MQSVELYQPPAQTQAQTQPPDEPIVGSRHHKHSSVYLGINGTCTEIRRGSLIYDAIPDRQRWNSVKDWMDAANNMTNNMQDRIWPVVWTPEQRWFAQWFRQSSLLFGPIGFVKGALEVIVRDSSTGYMIPLYMNLETGLFFANGQVGYSLRQLGIVGYEVYRFEDEVFYRLS